MALDGSFAAGRYPYSCPGDDLGELDGDGLPDRVGVPATIDPSGGAEICRVRQLPVSADPAPLAREDFAGLGAGWFVDDLSDERCSCCLCTRG